MTGPHANADDNDKSLDNHSNGSLLNGNVNEDTKVDPDEVKRIASGFVINWMNMKDGENGKLLWSSGKWYDIIYKIYFRISKLEIDF